MNIKDRMKALLQRFKNENNEDLFGICTSQLSQLYCQNSSQGLQLIFPVIIEFAVSKKTYKRRVAAALFEKIIISIYQHQNDPQGFIFKKDDLKFNEEKFIQELDRSKKDNIKNYDQLLFLSNDNLFKQTQENIRSFLSKKDNYLYSKSEKTIEQKEKNTRNKKVDENAIIQLVSDQISKNKNFEIMARHKGDDDFVLEDCGEGSKLDTWSENGIQSIFLFDIIFKIFKLLMFHQKWEIRHGSLLLLRAIARQINFIYAIIDPFDASFLLQKDITDVLQQRTQNDMRKNINECIKQKCLQLLALDRFSDFLNDKSNMTNRALAIEILVKTFLNQANLEQYYFLFESMFVQGVKGGWEPKQGFIYLSKELLDQQQQQSEGGSNIQLIPEKYISRICLLILKILEEHEEISEVACYFIQSLMRTSFWPISSDFTIQLQLKLIRQLKAIEDISYLPKAIFQLFRQLSEMGLLIDDVYQNITLFIQKYLFHNNSEVRRSVFQLLGHISTRDEKKIIKSQQPIIFMAVIYYHVVKKTQNDKTMEEEKEAKEETKAIVGLLFQMLKKAKGNHQTHLASLLFQLLDNFSIGDLISRLDLNFHYNIEVGANMDQLLTIEFIEKVISRFEGEELKELYDKLECQLENNQLAKAVFLLQEKSYYIFEQAQLELMIGQDSTELNVPFIERLVQKQVASLETVVLHNSSDFDFGQQEELEQLMVQILEYIENKSQQQKGVIKLHNTLLLFSQTLKRLIDQKSVDYSKLKICLELDNDVIPGFQRLHLQIKKYTQLFVCAASSAYCRLLINSQSLMDKSLINTIINSHLELLQAHISVGMAGIVSQSLFQVILVYQNEQKHPNNKIIQVLLSKAIQSTTTRNNLSVYFESIFKQFGPSTIQCFEGLNLIFSNEFILSSYIQSVLEYQGDTYIHAQIILDNIIDWKYVTIENLKVITGAIFQYLQEKKGEGKSLGLLNKFLNFLLEGVIQRKTVIFDIISNILEMNSLAFLPFSKIYIKEIIRAMNDQTLEDKQTIFELFSKILSLSYIDENITFLSQLSETLIQHYKEGKQLLYEFNNSKNFNVSLDDIITNQDIILRQYQWEGIKWLCFLFKYNLSGCLCDDMGLGKTIQALASISVQHINNPSAISLIVCPNNLVYHWRNECLNFIDQKVLRPVILSSNDVADTRLSMYINANPIPNLYITSYNTVVKNSLNFDYSHHTIIIDEAHLVKNQRSKVSQSIKLLKGQLKLALTGTPIQNNVSELWSIFDFLIPNYLGSSEQFNKNFRALLDLNLLSTDMSKMELTTQQKGILDSLHRKVLPFIMRREKKDVLNDLPDKVIQDFDCELTPLQRKLYEQAINASNIQNDVQDKQYNSDSKEQANSFLQVIHNVRLILNHPKLFLQQSKQKPYHNSINDSSITQLQKRDNYQEDTQSDLEHQSTYYQSGKFQALKLILNSYSYEEDNIFSCSNNPNKILLFTRSTKTLQLLSKYIKSQFPYMRHMNLNDEKNHERRQLMVDQFNKGGEWKIMLMTPKIGGLGINLSSANIVIMFDHDFNPMNDLQAIDRAHRIGQKNVVNVHRLVCLDTIEQKIMGIQRFKLSVANTVINYENASIKNIQDSEFIDRLDAYAQEGVQKQSVQSNEDNLGKIALLLKDSAIEQLWSEDEYEKEYI